MPRLPLLAPPPPPLIIPVSTLEHTSDISNHAQKRHSSCTSIQMVAIIPSHNHPKIEYIEQRSHKNHTTPIAVEGTLDKDSKETVIDQIHVCQIGTRIKAK